MTTKNYSLSFVIISQDTVALEVSANSQTEAVQLATDIVNENLESNQHCELDYVHLLNPPQVNSNYTSMASLYSQASAQPVQQEIPGYTRLIN